MSADANDRFAIGAIRRPHGIRGEASVEPWTDDVERFAALHRVLLVAPDETAQREATIESWRPHGDRVLVKFEAIETPEDVALLRGWTIEIPAAQAKIPEAGEYFLHDLIGLTMVDGAGMTLGEVIDVYEGGGGLLLAVRNAAGRTFEVPFAAEICTSIDLAEKRITVSLPEGLDEV